MNDLIKREDAIATVGVMYERCDTHDIIDYRDLMLEAVMVLPSAYRPQGEWLDTGKDPDHSHPLTAIWYRCSECGYGTNTKTNYCPDCGAEMKGEDDELVE